MKKYLLYKNEKIIADVYKTISDYDMIPESGTVIAAVSGGPDSMCMLDILIKISNDFDIKLMVAHVNHSIRAEDSDLDEKFTKEYCLSRGISFQSKKVDAKKYSKEKKLSLEESARILRYDYLNELAVKFSAVIAVAHHMDDQAETILLNLQRGTGTLGMSGMSPVSGNIIRPLLLTSKQDIDEYIDRHNLPYRVDKTNLETCARRNIVRIKLMPELEKLFGRDITESLCRTAILCGEDEKFISSFVRNKFDSFYNGDYCIPCDIIKTSDFAVSSRFIRILYEKVRGDCKNLTFRQVTALIKLCEKPTDGKKTDLCDGFCGWIKDFSITITSKPEYEEFCELLNERAGANKKNVIKFEIPMDSGNIFPQIQIFSKFVVNKKELVYNAKEWCFPVELTEGAVLRYRRAGDRIRPNRNSGSKLLKNYFTDRKIPLSKRDEMVVLAKDSDVLWVCGVGGVYSGEKPSDVAEGEYIKVWCG